MYSADSTISGPFREGEDVLQAGPDGLFYLGVVVEVEDSGCLVRFGDCTEKWSPFYDLRRLKEEVIDEENEKERRKGGEFCRVLEARKELSYDFDSLIWDDSHCRNQQERYCYCGESGDWYKKMLQCENCLQWFHQECIRAPVALLFGDRFWRFICTLCNGSGEEILQKYDVGWAEALHLVLFNLTIIHNKKYHDLETSILPFIKSKWKYLLGPSGNLSKSKANPNYLTSVLESNSGRFKNGSEIHKKSTYWGLRKVLPPDVPHKPESHPKIEPSLHNPQQNFHNASFSKGRRLLRPPRTPAMKFGGTQSSQNNNNKRPRRNRRDSGGESSPSDSDASSTRGTLDSFIPIPKNFEGFNNPFRLPKDSNASSAASSSCSSPSPLDLFMANAEDEEEKGKNFFKDLKSSLNSFFTETKFTRSEKFRVAAKRLTVDGNVQYLIDWEARESSCTE